MNEILVFVLGSLLLIDMVIGIAMLSNLYRDDFTILKGIRVILLCSVWFLFLDEINTKQNE